VLMHRWRGSRPSRRTPRVVAGEDLVHVTSRPTAMAAVTGARAATVRATAGTEVGGLSDRAGPATDPVIRALAAMADTVLVAAMAEQLQRALVPVQASVARCSRRTGQPVAKRLSVELDLGGALKRPLWHLMQGAASRGSRAMCICDRGYVDTIGNPRFPAANLRQRPPRGST